MHASLGLGTATAMPGYGLDASWSPKRRQVSELFRKAIRDGIRYIDTAADYADAEQWVGQAADLCRRSGVRVCTKLTLAQLESGEMARSLQRLGLERVDTLLLTGMYADDIRGPRSPAVWLDPGIGEQLAQVKQKGWAVSTGASTYGIEDALCVLEQPWCDAVQIEYSILNPSVGHAVRRFKGARQEIVARSVLCKGLLTERRRHANLLEEEASTILDHLEALSTEWGYDLPQLATRFALDTPCIDIVLIGMGTAAELQNALAVPRLNPLEPWQMDKLTEYDRSQEDWTHPERWRVKV